MASIDELRGNVSEDDGTIIDPNLRRRRPTVEEIAAQHGYKPTKDGKGQKEIDLVKDMGYVSDEEIAEKRMGQDDISKALGDDLMKAAERKKREVQAFEEALEESDGDIKEAKESVNITTGSPDFEALLKNPPDPLNKDLVEFNKQQKAKMMENATPEEKAAMGLVEEPKNKVTPFAKKKEEVEEPVITEDDEILNDMDGDGVDEIIVPSDDNIEEENDETEGEETVMENIREEDAQNDIPLVTEEEVKANTAPIVQDMPTEKVVKPVKAEEPEEDEIVTVNAAEKLANRAASVTPTELEGVDIDEELNELEREELAEDEEESKKVMKKKLESARNDIKNKVIPIAQKIDIKGFTMLNKPVTISNSVEMAKQRQHVRTARWALFSSKLPIEMSGFLGTEIDDLVRLSSIKEPTVSDSIKLYRLFYDHIVSPKPDTVEDWMKVVSIMDMKHLYAAVYKASFDGINFIPMDCTNPRCNNGFVTDSIPWESMVKYENDAARKECNKIYRSNPSMEDFKLYKTEVVPVSDVYAMSFKDPSIYDVQIAPLYLDPDWYQKMEGTISINAYIDNIYVIDQQNKALRPLYIKEYHGDPKKTLKAKVLALGKVLTTLSSDQYNLISSYIEEINKPVNYVDYQRPEVICPKCGTKIPAADMGPAELLFTRHRLTSLANG